MKKKLIKIGVLSVVFIIALWISSVVINHGEKDRLVDLGAPTIPRVSFSVGETEVNPLFGYTDEMDITAVRDTITPLESDGNLTVHIRKMSSKVQSISYEVYSLDGESVLTDGKAKISGESSDAVINLNGVLSDETPEAVLRLMIKQKENDGQKKTISFYTRIVRPGEVTTDKCLEFAKDFHTKLLTKQDGETISTYLEPSEESDNTTYQTVNIHSDLTHAQWGTLNPKILGDVEWNIKESNTVYTSILANYKVLCEDENGNKNQYEVKEFFRVRFLVDTIYLLDYNRNMEQIFSGEKKEFTDSGIQLGIVQENVTYEVNKDQTSVAFVQARELWLYQNDAGKLTKVFSFADQEGRDIRSENNQHAVRIISMDQKDQLVFAVYGYMNRGPHEGQVGVGIYCYDSKKEQIEEKAFITSTKSFAIAEDELGKMVYYNNDTAMLYVLTDGTLYQIQVDEEKQDVLAEGLTEGQYAVSADGHLMAYQTIASEDKEEKKKESDASVQVIRVMNLKTGKINEIAAKDSETLRPIGFVNGDFVYGKSRVEDEGTTVSGETISPMYEVEIRNSKNKKEASYNFTDKDIYTIDVQIEENLLTFHRVVKENESYVGTKQEYVTSNVERKESKITLESYATEQNGKQMRFVFADGIKEKKMILVKPLQTAKTHMSTIAFDEKQKDVKFYVYGMGELAAIYDKAGYAVRKAEQVSGVVISSEQKYVWEKGNRDLVYDIDVSNVKVAEGESTLEACEGYMSQYKAQKLDLTGCELEQVLYVINRGCPMILILDSGEAILLTGYSTTDITYMDPKTGEKHTVGMSTMSEMAESGGNTFIGYIR